VLALKVKNVDRKPDVLKEWIILDVECKSAVVVEEYMCGTCLWISKHAANKFLVIRISNKSLQGKEGY